jgi:multicomponent K+:H+ antiporter subunit G
MNMLIEMPVSSLLLVGASLSLIGSIGLVRLPDFFCRLHGPTKTVTLGAGGVLLASLLYFSARDPGISLHELLILLFLFITAPVSAHMMAKAALHLSLKTTTDTFSTNGSHREKDRLGGDKL